MRAIGKPSTPTPPDPQVTAAAQTASNRSTAITNAELNRVNTNTPYGSLNYSNTGTNPDGTPQYQADVSLSPAEQNLFNINTANQGQIAQTAQGMLGQVQSSYANPIDTSGAPGVASRVQQDGATTADAIKNAQDAAYHSQTQYLDPQFQQAEDRQRSMLANEGVASGSQAEQTANDNLARQKQAAYQSAQNAAVGQGQQEQNVLYGQGLQGANLQNSANQQYLSQLFALRNQPLNEFSALTSGSQVQNPNFPNIPGATQANTNVAGIYNDAYQNQLAAYNAKNQGINNLFSLGGGLGAAYLGNPAAFA